MDQNLPNTAPSKLKNLPKNKLIAIASLAALILIVGTASAYFFTHGPNRGQENGKQTGGGGQNSQSSDLNHGPNYKALATCSSNPTPLDTVPVDLSQIDQLVPLGQVGVPDHTLPTDHMYFSLNHVTNSDTVTPTIVSPGKIVIIQILNSGESKNGVQTTNDYAIDFAACQGAHFRFGHIEKLTGKLADAVKNKDWDQPCDKRTPAAGEETFYCTKSTDIVLNSGEAIGSVGGHNIGAFDLNAYDNTVKDAFIDPDRYSNSNAACGINYFNTSAKAQLLAKIKRTAEPRCGEVAQDKAGTAQGGWFATQDVQQSQVDWNSHLALIHHDIDPTIGILAIGGKISSPMAFFFKPTHSGNINREPSEITPGSSVYCYQNNVANNQSTISNNSNPTGSVVLQLTDDKTMKVAHQEGNCSANPTISNPTTYYR